MAGLQYGRVAKNCILIYSLQEQPDALQHNEMTNSETECEFR